MPSEKDFKRVVRARMQKTGESYTAARATLLNKKPSPTPAPAQTGPVPADYPRLAGMSDDAVKAKTGCTWQKWVETLDSAGARDWPHRDIAQYVHTRFKIPGWWAQTVTVGYERVVGLRDVGQRRGGSYEASKSKTIAVDVATLFHAFQDARTRRKWLPETGLTVRKATAPKSIRITWPDGTSVEGWFTAKGGEKSSVSVSHTKLPSKADADSRKTFWGERLEALKEALEG